MARAKTRKAAAKKPAAKAKKTSKKVAAPKKAAATAAVVVKQPKTTITTAYNKSKIMSTIAESAGIGRKQVAAVFEELSTLASRHLRKGGAGEFVIPGLVKCRVINKPATKARKGVNPFTGEEMVFKAKPARSVVKVRALKKLKEMVK